MTTANLGTCPHCQATVLWVSSGLVASMSRPFDPEPEARYLLSSKGPELVEVYSSHLDTCQPKVAARRHAETVNAAAPRRDR